MRALLLFLLTFPLMASAFRLDPMVAELSPAGSGSSRIFRVENNGQDRIAVQLKVTSRKVDSNGKEIRDPVSEFSVYPDQLSLGPNDTRNVRVTYNGPKDLSTEQAYRLIATQLPVDFKGEKKQAQLTFLFQYIASLYVKPDGAYPKMEVLRVEPLHPKKIRLTLANKGTAHRLLGEVRVELKTESGESISIPESSYKDWPSENILAGAERTLEIETSDYPAKAKLQATLRVQKSQ